MILRGHIFLLAFLITSLIFVQGDVRTQSEDETIEGPILAGIPVGGALITFHDLGKDRTWEVPLPNSSYVLYSWSPDGCDLLLRGSDGWKILSVVNSILTQIPQSSPVGQLSEIIGQTWTSDGKAITFSVWLSENNIHVYSVNVSTLEADLVLSLTERGRALQWFSDTKLLYETEDGYFVWDVIQNESYLYKRRPDVPPDWSSDVYLSYESPDREQFARFYSLNAFYSIVSSEEDSENREYMEVVEAIPQIPGFDIYSPEERGVKHIDVMGQFLQSLAWSPSSDRIVVGTDPITTPDNLNGIYVYNVNDKLLQRVGDFPAIYNPEYGPYLPSWSSDGKWLASLSSSGYIAYNLETEEMTSLVREFSSSYMSLIWSPIMEYDTEKCS